MDVPRFSRIARSYLLHIGNLDWTKINPDIFGSMIQAVAEDEERGALGMHYTSVPNILKVLNPLFLDDLRARLEEAGDNPRTLLNLRKRMSKIRVFDPACGSGNFLVIAYKEMRAIEAEINKRRGEAGPAHGNPADQLSRHRAARLPCRDRASRAHHRGISMRRALSRAEGSSGGFLPLDAQNWITCGNALRLDWLSICPPTGTGVKLQADDLFQHAARSGADRLRERGRGDVHLRKSALSREQVANRRAKSRSGGDLLDGDAKAGNPRLRCWLVHESADYGQLSNCFGCVCVNELNLPRRAGCTSLAAALRRQASDLLSPTRRSNGPTWRSHNAGVTVVIVGISNRLVKTRASILIAMTSTSCRASRSKTLIHILYPGRNCDCIEPRQSQSPTCLSNGSIGNIASGRWESYLSARLRIDALMRSIPEMHAVCAPFCWLAGIHQWNRHRYCLWIEDAEHPLPRRFQKLLTRIRTRMREMRAHSKAAQPPVQ